ncbi:MAG: YggT family protein [Commensalibacter sp.]|nr:YggT family protein [Commensalibacter sp.]
MIVGICTLLIKLLNLYELAIIIYCLFSFLYFFGIVDPRNQFVSAIANFLAQICEPVLSALRQILPTIGNIDLSPIVVILIINYLFIPFLRDIALHSVFM